MGKYRFSAHSKAQLKTCDYRLREIMNRAIERYDFSVLCGFRNEHDQNEAYDAGRSRLKFPFSKHNEFPSMAVDVCPYPVNFQDVVKFMELSIVIKEIAKEIMVPILWGGEAWPNFIDMPHWQLIEK